MSSPIGQLPERVAILNITNTLPCTISTDGDHGFSNKAFVRLTGLNGIGPDVSAHGADELNNNKYRIIVTDVDEFTLQDPITFLPIDSRNYPTYSTGGSCNLVQQTFIYYPSPEQEFPN